MPSIFDKPMERSEYERYLGECAKDTPPRCDAKTRAYIARLEAKVAKLEGKKAKKK